VSKPIKDGGPAFPGKQLERDGDCVWFETGMSLRDWFAGRVAGGDAAAEAGWMNNPTDEMVISRAKTYYQIADAMLKAREAGHE